MVSIQIMNQDHDEPTLHLTVKIFGGLRESFAEGRKEMQLRQDATFTDLLDAFGRDHPSVTAQIIKGMDAGYLNVLINGRNLHFLQGHTTQLNDGDTVVFVPPVGGG
jgi:sulfur-carrier protein